MARYTVSSALRALFLFAACAPWTGIALTGFRVVSQVLYVPAAFFSFAAITVPCPGLILTRRLFPEKRYNTACTGARRPALARGRP